MTPTENRPTPSTHVSFGPFLSLMIPPIRLPKTNAKIMYDETIVAALAVQP